MHEVELIEAQDSSVLAQFEELKAFINAEPGLTHEQKIYRLEAYCLAQPQVSTPLRHWFCNGMYAREFTVPAGTILTGAIHLHNSIAMMTQGRVRVISEDGDHDMVAPQTFIQPAGIKRCGLVLGVHARRARR